MNAWSDDDARKRADEQMARINVAALEEYGDTALPPPPIDYGPRYDVTITLSVYPRDAPGVVDHRSSVIGKIRKMLRHAEIFDHVEVTSIVRKTFPYS